MKLYLGHFLAVLYCKNLLVVVNIKTVPKSCQLSDQFKYFDHRSLYSKCLGKESIAFFTVFFN